MSDIRPAEGAATASWSRTGPLLVLSGDDGAARIVDRAGRVVAVLRGPPGMTVETPTFAPDGRTVAAVSAPRERVDFTAEKVVFWDVKTSEIVRTWSGLGSTGSLAFSPDGSLLAVGSENGSARLVSTQSGETLHVLAGHTSAVTDVDFSADGARLVTAGLDDTVRVWALDIDDLLAMARKAVTRSLTAEECRRYLHTDACG